MLCSKHRRLQQRCSEPDHLRDPWPFPVRKRARRISRTFFLCSSSVVVCARPEYFRRIVRSAVFDCRWSCSICAVWWPRIHRPYDLVRFISYGYVFLAFLISVPSVLHRSHAPFSTHTTRNVSKPIWFTVTGLISIIFRGDNLLLGTIIMSYYVPPCF